MCNGELLTQIEDLNDEIMSLEVKVINLNDEVESLDVMVGNLTNEVDNLDVMVGDLTNEVDNLRMELICSDFCIDGYKNTLVMAIDLLSIDNYKRLAIARSKIENVSIREWVCANPKTIA